MELRYYQQAAIEAVYEHIRNRDDNPCVVIPTGGGKTPVISTLCKDVVNKWNRRVLILAHVKELLEQAADTLNRIDRTLNVGVYSAGLGVKQTMGDVVVAGIQSVYKNAPELGKFDLIIIDEAHLIPPSGEGMYQTFLAQMKIINPNVRIVGLTATPYRLKAGTICSKENILNKICYQIGVKDLINDGYLSPLISKSSRDSVNTDGLHIRGGEFIPAEVAALVDDDNVVIKACHDIVQRTQDRNSVLIFAASVDHAYHVQKVLEGMGQNVEVVTGETLDLQREAFIQQFKDQQLKYLVNVNVLTTGFDAPNVDCVVLLRPTMSAGLYYQMVGRGFRICEGKENCLVLDYAQNVMRHGPVDQVKIEEPKKKKGGAAPHKICPKCESVNHTSYRNCIDCGHEFEFEDKDPHDAKAGEDSILSTYQPPQWYDVRKVFYECHYKRDGKDTDPRTLRVEYICGLNDVKKEWVCFEHKGFARQKAEAWWAARSNEPCPTTIEGVMEVIDEIGIAEPSRIKVKESGKFPEIKDYELGEKPLGREAGDDEAEWLQPISTNWEDDDDIPF